MWTELLEPATGDYPIESEYDRDWIKKLLEPIGEAIVEEGDPGEQAPVDARKRPATPSEQEVEDHEVNH